VMSLVHRRCGDSKAAVRRGALQLLEALLVMRASWQVYPRQLPSSADLALLEAATTDPLVSVCMMPLFLASSFPFHHLPSWIPCCGQTGYLLGMWWWLVGWIVPRVGCRCTLGSCPALLGNADLTLLESARTEPLGRPASLFCSPSPPLPLGLLFSTCVPPFLLAD
jgi:hypothetical protein